VLAAFRSRLVWWPYGLTPGNRAGGPDRYCSRPALVCITTAGLARVVLARAGRTMPELS
jgi:hypothetical protein